MQLEDEEVDEDEETEEVDEDEDEEEDSALGGIGSNIFSNQRVTDGFFQEVRLVKSKTEEKEAEAETDADSANEVKVKHYSSGYTSDEPNTLLIVVIVLTTGILAFMAIQHLVKRREK